MNKKIILYIVISLLVLLLLLKSFSLINLGNRATNGDNGDYSNLPEKCRPPQGQDIQAWKEHLGHHAETQDCLKYFK